MKTGIYKDSGGGEMNVVGTDEQSRKLLVDHDGKQVWYEEIEWSTWIAPADETSNPPTIEENIVGKPEEEKEKKTRGRKPKPK